MIGVGVPAREAAHALEAGDLLTRLGPRWLVCEIDLRLDHGRVELERYRALAELTGAEITLEIITRGSLDPMAELAPLAKAATEAGLIPAAVSVFRAQEMKSVQPDVPWPAMPTFEETYAAASQAFPDARPGGGMATYFTELNRKRPPLDRLDLVTFTTSGLVHAGDDRSATEGLEALPFIAKSVAAIAGSKPWNAGPSALGMRGNPYGAAPADNPQNIRQAMNRMDPRQRGLLGAAFYLGYFAHMARGGAASVT
ncbi:MAG: hypothetical protein H0T41_11785, partial [Rhodobacteraceae bacterium]|nr:hypothetical protein [Paracoccaceae bacterium]